MTSLYLLIPVSSLCFLVFFKATRIAWEKGNGKIFTDSYRSADILSVCKLQIIGIFLFGFVSLIIRNPEQRDFLLFPKNEGWNIFPVLGLLFISVLIISWLAAEKKIKQPGSFNFPVNGNLRNIALYIFLRILFLVAYEFFFRGVLLFDIALLTGIGISILINIVLYVIIHLFDDQQTIIGTVPFGIVLCWLSWRTQSIWPAVILHLVLSLTYEIKVFVQAFQSTQKIMT